MDSEALAECGGCASQPTAEEMREEMRKEMQGEDGLRCSATDGPLQGSSHWRRLVDATLSKLRPGGCFLAWYRGCWYLACSCGHGAHGGEI